MKRKDAGILGLKKYPADQPCKKCNTSERYTSTGGCVACLYNRTAILPRPRAIFSPDALPTTRAEAFALGSKFYKTGEPCANGHVYKRNTRYGYCVMCNRVKASKSHFEGDRARRSAGMVKIESWVYAADVGRLTDFTKSLVDARDQKNPAVPPMPLPPSVMPLMPQVPVARAHVLPDSAGLRPDSEDRHPNDYDMS